MNFSLILILVLAFWTCPTEQQGCHTSELNACVFPIVLNARGALMPRTNETLTSSCKIWKNFWKCIENYLIKCVSDLHREMIAMVLWQPKRNFEGLCDTTSKLRRDFEKHLPCSSDSLTLTLQTCTDNLENIIHMKFGVNEADGVHAVCCYLERFDKCLRHNIEKSCKKGAIKAVYDYLKFFHYESAHTLCSSYDPDSELCTDYLSRVVPAPFDEASYVARVASRFLRVLQQK